MNLSKYKIEKSLGIVMFLFALISVVTIYSAEKMISPMPSLYMKQILWYAIGLIMIVFIMKIGNAFFIQKAFYFYGIGNVCLLLLLFFAREINDAKCWFELPGIGTIQPSEFMKIILILTLAKVLQDFHTKYEVPTIKDEFFLLIKVALIVLLPSILTFLEPDTGIVFIYLLITFTMLFISGIRFRWFFLMFSLFAVGIFFLFLFYFQYRNLFIDIFGTSFFLRIDRLLDWSSKSGFQLEHGLASIGSAGLFGHGLFHTPLYFPEAQTDFIFAVYASNFGFIGSFLLLVCILYFDLKLIHMAKTSKKIMHKYILAGMLGMLVYQQVQNIGMTFGVMPITGITLPFISYGGSSLLSYMLMAGILLNISHELLHQT